MAAETEARNVTNLNTQEQFIFLMSQENRVLDYKIISTIHEWFTVKILFYKCKHTIKLYTQNNNNERLFSPNSPICNKIIKLNIY